MVPPIKNQAAFAREAEAVSSILRRQAEALNRAAAVFDALLAMAFAPAATLDNPGLAPHTQR